MKLHRLNVIGKNWNLKKLKVLLSSLASFPLTVHPVKGKDVQGGVPPHDLLLKLKIEIVVKDEDIEKVVDAIVGNARRGIPEMNIHSAGLRCDKS